MALTLSLVRHGQTVYNAEGRLQGWCDSPLTARGLAGVRTTAAHLARRPVTVAYVSPAGRAQTTAHEIMAHHPGAPLVTDPDLREFGFGDLEARPETDLAARYDPDTMFDEVLRGTFAGIPGGETGAQLRARVRSAFARIEQRHQRGHVLVVGHGLTLRAYLMMIGSDPAGPLPNASVSTVEVDSDGRRRVVASAVDVAGQGVPDVVGAAPALAR
ncbi:histidine phosphatase family protein [Actinotalea sp. K2]|uniref:histidine phosphatase family protein n=1 Tax=Actinotalea sp. K2 TaxID=2939438 RepID=UPI0020171D5A|nr:histidine phosphatase family protein [Actinotalea sp. K2]MCL3860880.1 histidine phosphatase family protein [Actinotalea sp. K2]